jgi:hypothetical protein
MEDQVLGRGFVTQILGHGAGAESPIQYTVGTRLAGVRLASMDFENTFLWSSFVGHHHMPEIHCWSYFHRLVSEHRGARICLRWAKKQLLLEASVEHRVRWI